MKAPTERRGFNREEAAAYVGVGVTLFDKMVADGRMPKPKVAERRRIWDRGGLDRAFEALPDASGKASPPKVNWTDVAV